MTLNKEKTLQHYGTSIERSKIFYYDKYSRLSKCCLLIEASDKKLHVQYVIRLTDFSRKNLYPNVKDINFFQVEPTRFPDDFNPPFFSILNLLKFPLKTYQKAGNSKDRLYSLIQKSLHCFLCLIFYYTSNIAGTLTFLNRIFVKVLFHRVLSLQLKHSRPLTTFSFFQFCIGLYYLTHYTSVVMRGLTRPDISKCNKTPFIKIPCVYTRLPMCCV